MSWIMTSTSKPPYGEHLPLIIENTERVIGYLAMTDKDGDHWFKLTETGKKEITNVYRWYQVPDPS